MTDALIGANEVSIDHVSSLFNTCNPIDVSNSNDVKSFMELLIDNLAGVVQYDGRSGRTSIADVCEILKSENGGEAIGKTVLSTLHI